jgi:hypothetical protein
MGKPKAPNLRKLILVIHNDRPISDELRCTTWGGVKARLAPERSGSVKGGAIDSMDAFDIEVAYYGV